MSEVAIGLGDKGLGSEELGSNNSENKGSQNTKVTGFLAAPRLKTISIIALPVLAAMLTQNLMSAIDTGMIGQLGDTALASISVGGNQFFMVFSLLMGVSAAVQTLVSRRIGEGRTEGLSMTLTAGLVLAGMIATILLPLAYLLLPLLSGIMTSDPEVVAGGRDYLFAVLPAVVFGGLAMAFGGYWLGIGKPGYGLIVVLIQLFCNAGFNYVLIFGHLGFPRMEISGAGLGTTMANMVGVLAHCCIAYRVLGRGNILQGMPDKSQLKGLLAISIPMSIQQFLFAVGMLVFVGIVATLGTKDLAAFQVIATIMMTSLMIAIGLGITATSLVSGALGRKAVADAKRWGWEIATVSSAILGLICLVSCIYARPILDVFMADPETVELAVLPLRIMLISIWIESFGRVLSMGLVGAGAVGVVFKITFSNQWLMRLPMYWLVGVYFGQGLIAIFLIMLAFYVLQTLLFVIIWQRERWAKIEV